MGCSPAAAHKISLGPAKTPKTMRGRPKKLTPDDRKKLIEMATQSAENRRKPFAEIAKLCGITACETVLRRAFEDEGYHRRVARKKPFLNEISKQQRLEWCLAHRQWTVENWMRVIWTDEASFAVGGVRGRIWVTRSPEEEYNEDCLVPKFKKLSGLMIWRAFIGIEKGPLVFWDSKNWGKITALSYSTHILPYLYHFWHTHSLTPSGHFFPAAFMEDGAPGHRAALTTQYREWMGFQPFKLPWPASSPDLNLIEAIWCTMKDRLFAANQNGQPRTVEETSKLIVQIWNEISAEELRRLVESMPERVEAVIAAGGGHTKY